MALEGPAWFERGARCYLDWYVVEGFESLGSLQRAAISGPRMAVHNAVASRSGPASGGLMALGSGGARPPAGPTLAFVDKPRGVPYGEFKLELDKATGLGAPVGRGDTVGRSVATGRDGGLDPDVTNGRDEASRQNAGTAPVGAWWMRQLVLGPGPEVIVVTNGPLTNPMATVHTAAGEVIDAGS